MSKGKGGKKLGIILLIVTLVVLLIAGFGGNFVYGIMQRQIISQEIDKINNQKMDTQIYAKGKYGEVEKAIKDYVNEYVTYSTNFINSYEESKLSSDLLASNYQEDGPEFNSTMTKITDMKQKCEEYQNELTKVVGEEYIETKANEAKLTGKYKELFKESLNFNEEAEDLKNQSVIIQEYLGKVEEILKFLKENSSSWKVSGSLVQFNNQSLVNQYNALTQEAKTIATKINTAI